MGRACVRALAGILAWFGAAGILASPTDDELPVDLGELLAPIFAEARIPGGAAVVLRGDRVVAQGVAGVRKRGAPEPISLDDKFHLGSCTKAMTATLVALLIEDGRLTWTSTLGELFGHSIADMHPAWRGIGLQQVLAHRAGLSRNVSRTLALRLLWSREPVTQLRARVASEFLSRKPEAGPDPVFSYSNIGYIIAGAALEMLAGRAWEELMRERVYEPLGITTGGFGAPGTPGTVDQPRGHRRKSADPVEPGSGADNPRAMGPAGTAHMSIGDWAKFVAVHLRGHPANPQRNAALLGSDSFAGLFDVSLDETYAGGWIKGARRWARGARPGDTGLTLSHTGSNTLWFCAAWMAPEIDFAVLVAVNAAHDDARAGCTRVVDALARTFAPTRAAAR